MYINFKSKYKKIIWLLLGFLIACVFIQKVNALTIYDSNGDITVPDVPNDFSNQGFTIYQTYNSSFDNFDTFLLVFNSPNSSTASIDNVVDSSLFNFNFRATTKLYSLNNNSWAFEGNYNSFGFWLLPSDGSRILATTIPITANVPGIDSFPENFGLTSSLPVYLTGYKKITLTTEDKYYMLSGLSSGSVFIPIDDFINYGGRLSYYDNDINSQPYNSYIQDYVTTEDGLFVRQDFNLVDYVGADWVMFSKYIYLEGEDNISYDIWVPNEIYDSQVTITPNSSGGNSFDFNYKDSNGDIQSEQFNSIDLSQTSPLFNNFFKNFSSNTFGLSSIISSPLSLIESIDGATCTPLVLPLPFLNSNLTLPCMYSFYQDTFGSLFTLYQTITFGIVSYWVGVRVFQFIKEFKDPDHDEIEVLDL